MDDKVNSSLLEAYVGAPLQLQTSRLAAGMRVDVQNEWVDLSWELKVQGKKLEKELRGGEAIPRLTRRDQELVKRGGVKTTPDCICLNSSSRHPPPTIRSPFE